MASCRKCGTDEIDLICEDCRWIDVKDGLPECEIGMPGYAISYSRYVLLYTDAEEDFTDEWKKGYIDNDGCWWYLTPLNMPDIKAKNITHYMEISPPSEREV